MSKKYSPSLDEIQGCLKGKVVKDMSEEKCIHTEQFAGCLKCSVISLSKRLSQAEAENKTLNVKNAVMLETLRQIWIWAKEYPVIFSQHQNHIKILHECDKFFQSQERRSV